MQETVNNIEGFNISIEYFPKHIEYETLKNPRVYTIHYYKSPCISLQMTRLLWENNFDVTCFKIFDPSKILW